MMWSRVKGSFSHCEIPKRETLKHLLCHEKTLFGELEFFPQILNMSETPPYFDKLPVPLGINQAKWDE